jgi:hypothetical protein
MTMATLELEQRVAILEDEMARLKRALADGKKAAVLPWWEKTAGTFADDPIYVEAM